MTIMFCSHSLNTKPKSYGNLSNRDLGISEFEGMIFDLEDLFPPVIDLSDLETNFTIEEVDRIISELPNDKSPGPDGFNTNFVKKCWTIICEDFYKLSNDFHSGDICL